jgi:hypothetical protein
MRRRTALSVVSAAVGGAIVPLAFAPAPAAAQERRSPQSPSARWDFDERTGTVTHEAVSGTADPIGYVFDDARYKPDSDPVRRRGVRGRALYFDGYSTVVTADGPGKLDPAGGFTLEAWIAPYAYEQGIDGKPQALVNQHNPDAKTGFLLGLRRFGQIVFQLGFGTDLIEVKGASDQPAVKGRWTHVAATYDPAARQLCLYRDGRLIGTATPVRRGLSDPSCVTLLSPTPSTHLDHESPSMGTAWRRRAHRPLRLGAIAGWPRDPFRP